MHTLWGPRAGPEGESASFAPIVAQGSTGGMQCQWQSELAAFLCQSLCFAVLGPSLHRPPGRERDGSLQNSR